MPSRQMMIAGAFMAVIVATTILNYTFAGVSILFMILMMRAGTLILSPLVDSVRHRRIRAYSWVAVVLSLIAVAVAVTGVDAYALTFGAVLRPARVSGRLRRPVRDHEPGSRRRATSQVDRRYFRRGADFLLPPRSWSPRSWRAAIGAGNELATLQR